KGVNNAELTVGDDDIINGNKFTAVKLNLNDVELTANTVKIDIDLANIASINGVKVNNVGGAYVVLTADGKSYEMTKDEDNYISFTELAAGGDSSDEKAVIHVPTHAITGTEDASDYIFEMAEGTQSVDIKKDAELKVAGIAKNENGGITNITLAQNAKLTVGDGEGAIESLGKFTTSSKAEFTAGDVTATNMNTVLNIGADNKGSMDVVDLKGGSNSVTVGARSTVDMESLSGVTSLKMTAGTFTKGNAKKGTVDKTEYTDLTVGGDITVAEMNSTIALGNYNKLTVSGSLVNDDTNVGTAITAGNDAHINFTGDVNGASKITIGTASSLTAQDITGLVGNNTLNFGKDSVVTAKSINMKGGLDTLTIGVNAQLNVAEDIKGIYRITSSKDAKITVDNIINNVQANTYNFGADNEVTVNGGITMNNALRNNIIVGNRADMTVAKDIDGVASLSLYAGTFTKGNAKKGTVDKTEYTTLTVGGDIITAAVNSTISLSNYGKLTVAGDVYASNSKFGITVKGGTDANIDVTGAMSNITSINLGADSSLKAAAINGTAANNALTFGKGANVEVKGDISLGEGKDSINLGADATLNVANINGVYMITTGKGAKFTAVDLVNTDAANNYNFGANNIVSLNDVTMNDTFKNTLKVGADSEFTANNIVGAYNVNVGKNAKFTVAEISGTEFADIYTIGQDAEVKVTASIELGAGNDSLKLGVGSDMEVTNGISFGDGKDTLTFSKDAELKVYGGVVAGLETVSGTASNTIYLYNGASIENMDSIKGIDKINVIEVIDFVNATAADSWDTESLSNGNNMDTFNLSGNEEFKVESLKNISVSYLKDDVWYDLTDASMTIAGATMVNVSLDKDYKGELEYNYSITIA
ncbi:MAG: hypothetical protein IJW31_03335, partial [Lentisphaeria bacterium]|nr:hypothetical protein [Lentisphaeria bacterium]